jgi:hypothetical protein
MVQLNATALLEYGSAAWAAAALILVHEATHARIQATIPGYAGRTERDRVREERVCKEAELDFVRELPDPALLETHILKELGALDEVYSDAAQERTSHEAIVEIRREVRRLWSALMGS